MSLGRAHHWRWRRPKRTRALVRMGGRTGMKHDKGIEYDGVGWLMTGSGCGWMEFIALTQLHKSQEGGDGF